MQFIQCVKRRTIGVRRTATAWSILVLIMCTAQAQAGTPRPPSPLELLALHPLFGGSTLPTPPGIVNQEALAEAPLSLNGLTLSEIKQFTPALLGALKREQIQDLTLPMLTLFVAYHERDFPYAFLTELQWASLPPELSDRYGANIEACCIRIKTQVRATEDSTFEVIRYSPDKDPFDSGPMPNIYAPLTTEIKLTEGVDYQYIPPDHLGTTDLLKPFRMMIPKRRKFEKWFAYHDRRYEQTVSKHIARSSLLHDFNWETLRGSTSTTFFPHKNAPSLLLPFVVKLREPFPWLDESRPPTADIDPREYTEQENKCAQLAIAHARKDLVLPYALAECAQEFKTSLPHPLVSATHSPQPTASMTQSALSWRRFIHVHPYVLDHMNVLRQGVFIQRRIPSGATAYAIAKELRNFEKLQTTHPLQAHMAVNETLRRIGIPDVKTAKKILALLEIFYEKTQLDLIHFKDGNALTETPNYVQRNAIFKDGLMSVGADFNRGNNAIWNPRDSSWHIIDF